MELPDLSGAPAFDERLRAYAVDEPRVEAALAAARERLASEHEPRTQLRLLGYVGNALRMLRRHAEAVETHERALALAEEHRFERALVAARIRLGEARRCADELERAERDLRLALELARRRPELGLVDFALQHLGKCLLDAGRPREAEDALQEASALRLAKGEDELVDSTRFALDLARRRVQNSLQ